MRPGKRAVMVLNLGSKSRAGSGKPMCSGWSAGRAETCKSPDIPQSTVGTRVPKMKGVRQMLTDKTPCFDRCSTQIDD